MRNAAFALIGVTALSANPLQIGKAKAEVFALQAVLDAGQEVPPLQKPGTGRATLKYDDLTRQLQFSIVYENLSGPATGAHIHGPALPGEVAAIVVKFGSADSPISGTATLSGDIARALLAGRTYVNIHTEAHPDGEIRGQVVQ